MASVSEPITSTMTSGDVPGGHRAAKPMAARDESAVPMFCPMAMPVTRTREGNCSGKNAGKTALYPW